MKIQEINVAWNQLPESRLFHGILQRRRYNAQTGMLEWYTFASEGGWKSLEWNGKTRSYSLRKMGGHKDCDHTQADIHDAVLYWERMKVDIDSHTSTCQRCRWVQGRQVVTGQMHTRERYKVLFEF